MNKINGPGNGVPRPPEPATADDRTNNQNAARSRSDRVDGSSPRSNVSPRKLSGSAALRKEIQDLNSEIKGLLGQIDCELQAVDKLIDELIKKCQDGNDGNAVTHLKAAKEKVNGAQKRVKDFKIGLAKDVKDVGIHLNRAGKLHPDLNPGISEAKKRMGNVTKLLDPSKNTSQPRVKIRNVKKGDPIAKQRKLSKQPNSVNLNPIWRKPLSGDAPKPAPAPAPAPDANLHSDLNPIWHDPLPHDAPKLVAAPGANPPPNPKG